MIAADDTPRVRTSDITAVGTRRAREISAFRVHAAVFAVSTLAISAVNLLVNLSAGLTGELSAWWALWVLIGWGIGIAIHGLVVAIHPALASSPR